MGQHLEERHSINKDRQMRILEHYLEVKKNEKKNIKKTKNKNKTRNQKDKYFT